MQKQISLRKVHFKFKDTVTFQKHLIKFGVFGLKIIKTICVLKTQQNFFKLFLLKNLRNSSSKKNKIMFFMNCFYSKTKLASESRMGKGKGDIFTYFGYYKKGFILVELTDFPIRFVTQLINQINKKKIFRVILV